MSNQLLGIGNENRTRFFDFNSGNLQNVLYTLGLFWPQNELTFKLSGSGVGDHDALVHEIVQLEHFLADSDDYRDDWLRENAFFLYRQNTGEAILRRFITGWARANYGTSNLMTPFEPQRGAVTGDLTINLHPAWEEATPKTASTELTTLQTPAGGTLPGRIANFTISFATGGFSSEIETVWAGIKPIYTDDLAGFQPTWDLRIFGAVNTAYTVDFTHGVQADLTDNPELHSITAVKPRDVSGTSVQEYRGEYMILLEYRLAGTTSAALIQFAAGYWDTEIKAKHQPPPVRVDSTDTDHKIVALGKVSFPIVADRHNITTESIADQLIWLRGKRLAGSDDLYLRTLYLIPSYHSILIEKAKINATHSTQVIVYHNDSMIALSNDFDTRPTPNNWVNPRSGGILVVRAAGANNVHDPDNDLAYSMTVHNRWRTYQRQAHKA